jgi:DNA primase catalytic subunit
MMTLNEFGAFRKNNSQHGLFTTAYRYDKAEIRDANMIGNLYLDFDVTDIDTDFEHIQTDAVRALAALKAIFGIKRESVQIYFSGNKGIHFVIPAEVIGVQPHAELNMIFKLIANDMNKLTKHHTIDTGIYDKVRLFRIPNSVHPKTGLYKVPITLEELLTSNLSDLKLIASKPRAPLSVNRTYSTQANRIYQDYIKEWDQDKKRMTAKKNKAGTSTLDFMPTCIEHILSEGAPNGKRNNTSSVLASYFMQRGVKEVEAVDRVLEWNDMCTPPQPKADIEKTVRSIYRAEHRYGCRALRELSICSTSCRLYKDDGRKS